MSLWSFTSLTIIPPFLIGALLYQKLSISHRFLFFFVGIGFLTEILIFYLKFVGVKNNMPLGHIYISLSFIFIAIFYLYELEGYINRKIIGWSIILFEAFSIFNVLYLQSYFEYPSTTGSVSALMLVIYSILLFSRIMVTGKIKRLSQSSLIWINTAVLIYYSGNFFFYILFNLILNLSTNFIHTTVNFFKIIYIIFYSLLAIGFWKAGTIKQQ